DNYSTQPGEGFQQEVQQAYDQTNLRKVESQMVKIDENQEVIATICMNVNQYDQNHHLIQEELDVNDSSPLSSAVELEAHWAVGSPLPKIDSLTLEEE
ncbi:hypothetical protein M422DRAFT_137172, partial [Sphaerobolus stellatus SS14]